MDDDEAVPEIEYMAPREVPLPDYPDDWPHDRTYPQFEGNNFTRGWWSEFANQKGDDDDTEFSDFEEELKKLAERERKKKHAQHVKKAPLTKTSALEKTTRHPLTAKPPQTVKAKSAASALSQPLKPAMSSSTIPKSTTFPKPTSRKPTTGVPSATGNPRHTAAKVASNTTLGYSKGRVVSGVRRPQSDVTTNVDKSLLPANNISSDKTSLDDLFALSALNLGGGEGDDVFARSGKDILEEDDELKDFQLDVVEI